MAGKSNICYGNEILDTLIYLPALPYPSIGSATTANNTYTVPGVQVGDLLSWNQQSYVATLTLDNMFVSAINTISVTWTSTAAISNGTVPVLVELVRTPDVLITGISGLPSAIV